jgi:glutathione peroxidase
LQELAAFVTDRKCVIHGDGTSFKIVESPRRFEHKISSMTRTGALVFLAGIALVAPLVAQRATTSAGSVSSFYDLKTTTLDGKPADLAQYKGTVSLVVNVASKCGYTPQYAGLEKLQREMKDQGFNVLGFPSNDFGRQEPGTAQEIADFCRLTYDVTFPMFEKVVTRKGTDQSPIYTFLGRSGNLPAWNFSKYVVDKQGKVVAFFESQVTPEHPDLRAALRKALASN